MILRCYLIVFYVDEWNNRFGNVTNRCWSSYWIRCERIAEVKGVQYNDKKCSIEHQSLNWCLELETFVLISKHMSFRHIVICVSDGIQINNGFLLHPATYLSFDKNVRSYLRRYIDIKTMWNLINNSLNVFVDTFCVHSNFSESH